MAQIKFPGTPIERSMPGKLVVYAYQGIQQGYVVQAAHLKKPTIGPSASDIRDDFFNDQIKLEIDALKGTLLYKKNIQIDGVNGVEYSYNFVIQNVKIYNYNRFVFLNEVGIDYYIMSREPLKQEDKVLNDYFNSFKITISKKNINSLK
ncbi:MAG: hypothetical protein JWP71_1164 [Mucilaginibacter sp.]|nr:hypothetical protein [Mucilaginibacter sp.]